MAKISHKVLHFSRTGKSCNLVELHKIKWNGTDRKSGDVEGCLFVWINWSESKVDPPVAVRKKTGKNLIFYILLTLKRLGEVNLTPFCNYCEIVSSRERMHPWYFVTFDIITSYIFPENFIETHRVVQKIWRFSSSTFFSLNSP